MGWAAARAEVRGQANRIRRAIVEYCNAATTCPAAFQRAMRPLQQTAAVHSGTLLPSGQQHAHPAAAIRSLAFFTPKSTS